MKNCANSSPRNLSVSAYCLTAQTFIVPDAVACVRGLAAELPLAIASGALLKEIEAIVARAGLRDCFRAIVSADAGVRSKPAPRPVSARRGAPRGPHVGQTPTHVTLRTQSSATSAFVLCRYRRLPLGHRVGPGGGFVLCGRCANLRPGRARTCRSGGAKPLSRDSGRAARAVRSGLLVRRCQIQVAGHRTPRGFVPGFRRSDHSSVTKDTFRARSSWRAPVRDRGKMTLF